MGILENYIYLLYLTNVAEYLMLHTAFRAFWLGLLSTGLCLMVKIFIFLNFLS